MDRPRRQGGVMLTISRKASQSIQIGEDITVTIKEINGQEARVSIDAPPETKILRDNAIKKEKILNR